MVALSGNGRGFGPPSSGQLSPTESETVLNRAAAKAIAEQRDLGVDEWSGGEISQRQFHSAHA
jgi:methionine synthase II (cobalamin-independent)